jgi:enterochelin esterase-like enzyme
MHTRRSFAALGMGVLAVFACSVWHASAAPLTPTELASYPFCEQLHQDTRAIVQERVAEARSSCRVHVDDVTPALAQAVLGDKPLVLARDGDRITIYARLHAEAATLCCSMQTQMTRVGDSDFWVARFQMSDLGHAMLTFIPPVAANGDVMITPDQVIHFRGPEAPPEPDKIQPIHGRTFEATFYSSALHETRKLRIYLPPGYVRGEHYPALFVADGEAVDGYAPIAEALVAQHKMRPTIMIGSLAGQHGIVEDRSSLHIDDLRHADYIPNYPGAGDRFEQHQQFFCRELTRYAERTYGVSSRRADRAVTGFSDGGVFALWAGIRCADQFATAWPMSGGVWESHRLPRLAAHVRFLVSAGIYEPAFHYNMRRAVEALRAAGQQVEMRDYAAGHMPDQWELAFADDAAKTFPP